MKQLPQCLQYGEEVTFHAGLPIYRPGDDPGEKPIYYIIAGLVKIELHLLNGVQFPLYLPPDSLFGLVEPFAKCNRLTYAFAMENTILYRWDVDNFFTAAGVSWELALIAMTGLTRMLRILNAEFGEKLGMLDEAGK